MNTKALKALVLLMSTALVAALTLSVVGLLDPLAFWVLAGLSAAFAFLILPRVDRRGKRLKA